MFSAEHIVCACQPIAGLSPWSLHLISRSISTRDVESGTLRHVTET